MPTNKKIGERENKVLELGLGRESEDLACESFPNRIRKQKLAFWEKISYIIKG